MAFLWLKRGKALHTMLKRKSYSNISPNVFLDLSKTNEKGWGRVF